MGNGHRQKDQFTQIIKELKRQKNKQPLYKVDARPDQGQRYRGLMLEALNNTKYSQLYRVNLQNCITRKITKDQLSSALMILNMIKQNDIPSQFLKPSSTIKSKLTESNNVKVNFKGLTRRKSKYLDEKQIKQGQEATISHIEDTIEGRIKSAGDFISLQISKKNHPFSKLCAKFAQLLPHDELISGLKPQNQLEYEKWQLFMHNTIKQFCQFLIRGCIEIYKKWLLEYTGIQAKKYQKWIFMIVMNQVWVVSDFSLYKAVQKLIRNNGLPLKVPAKQIFTQFSSGNIDPELFSIDKQLQIQGHYFGSVFQLSQLCWQAKPLLLLKQLKKIKNSICIDVDKFHELQQKNQIYEINSDNILGIVAYLLAKLIMKINQIQQQLLYLRIVYGEQIYFSMNVSSYMYSTLVGAIQFLQGQQFMQLLVNRKKMNKKQQQKQQDSKILQQLKDTDCFQSVVFNKVITQFEKNQ